MMWWMKALAGIIIFFLLFTFFLFFLMVTQEGVGSPFIGNFSQVGQDLSNANVSAEIALLESKYELAQLNYDWVFAGAWLLFEVSLIALAIKSPALPKWDLLTLMFFGLIFLLFMYSFVMDLLSWFIDTFILGVFSADVTYLPFYLWYTDNQIMIMVLNVVGALVINSLFGKKGIVNTSPLLGGTQ